MALSRSGSKDDLNIINSYAIEILKSMGKALPLKEEIIAVERILQHLPDNFSSSEYFQQLLVSTPLKGKALLIEDEFILAVSHYIFLANLGYQVQLVDQSNKAISPITETKYDLILLNDHLPAINGLMLVRYVHDIETLKKPLVMLYAKSMLADKDKAFFKTCGADAILTLPLSFSELSQKLSLITNVTEANK
jgi:CheY-like chemotaxis protein